MHRDAAYEKEGCGCHASRTRFTHLPRHGTGDDRICLFYLGLRDAANALSRRPKLLHTERGLRQEPVGKFSRVTVLTRDVDGRRRLTSEGMCGRR